MLSSLARWFRPRSRTIVNGTNSRKKAPFRLRLEALEDRCVPASVLNYAVTDLSSPGYDVAYGVGMQSDGAIVVAGTANQTKYYTSLVGGLAGSKGAGTGLFALARYDDNLNLLGSTTTAITSGKENEALAMAIQPDDKVVLVGWTATGNAKLGDENFAIARYNANGTLDTTFNSGKGFITTNVPGNLPGKALENDHAQAVAIDDQGRIVVAGFAFNGTNNAFAVARYNSNGTLDASFNGTGVFVGARQSGSDYHASSIVIQPDGKIVVGGTNFGSGGSIPGGGQLVLYRFNPNGTLDASFDGDGIVAMTIPGSTAGGSLNTLNALALDADGNIITAGRGGATFLVNNESKDASIAMVARFSSLGSLDTTFANGAGFVLTDISGAYGLSEARAVNIQNDGKIVVGGVEWDADTHPHFAIVRYNADGTLDTDFDGDGIFEYAFPGAAPDSTSQIGYGLGLTSAGNIVLAGTTYTPIPGLGDARRGATFGVILLDPTTPRPPQIGSFTAGPIPVTEADLPILTALDAVALTPGATITHVAFYVDSNNNGVLDEDDTLLEGTYTISDDDWTLTFSAAGWAPGTYTLFAQALDSNSLLSDPVSTELFVVQ